MTPDEMLAATIARQQNHEDRLTQNEQVFGQSAIIPGDKVNAFLVASVAIIFIICSTFAFIWFLDRPI